MLWKVNPPQLFIYCVLTVMYTLTLATHDKENHDAMSIGTLLPSTTMTNTHPQVHPSVTVSTTGLGQSSIQSKSRVTSAYTHAYYM